MSENAENEEVIVHHWTDGQNIGCTAFRGPDIDYRVEDDGSLRIIKWVTDLKTGDALFAPGRWSWVVRGRVHSA